MNRTGLVPRLSRILHSLWDATDAYRSLYYGSETNRDHVRKEHDAILDAVGARDVEQLIHAEKPGVTEETRPGCASWVVHPSSYFECMNPRKLSITLDLNAGYELDAAHELATVADVIVENFRAERPERFRWEYRDVRDLNLRVTYCSVGDFGHEIRARALGYYFIVQANLELISILESMSKDAAVGIQAAFPERHPSDTGQHLEVTLLSSLLGSLVYQISSQLASGDSPGEMDRRHPSAAPYKAVHSWGDSIAVACGTNGHPRRLPHFEEHRPGSGSSPITYSRTVAVHPYMPRQLGNPT